MSKAIIAPRTRRQRLTRPRPLPPRDSSIATRAEAVLKRSRYRELGTVHCYVEDGALVLVGQVSSYFLKQMAQALLRRVIGSLKIENELEVVYPSRTGHHTRH